MTRPAAAKGAVGYKPAKVEFAALRLWHAWVAGAFLVAWLTGDEDTYAMHVFAGYAVLAAVAVRLTVALLAPPGSPWRLPRLSLAAAGTWLAKRTGRNPLFAWLGAAMLLAVGLAAVTGALADGVTWLEDPHEALSEASLWPIFAHIGFILFIYGGRRWLGRVRQAAARLPTPQAREISR